MMFGRFFFDRDKGLRDLIRSFGDAFEADMIRDLLEYVDHNEPGLALEILGDWIYENDIGVSDSQQQCFVIESNRYGINPERHGFLNRQPPYPDLRTLEQLADEELKMTPSLDSVQMLARSDRKILAVRMYRELTGATLEEAVAAVEHMV
jgi:hypothetical protein